MFPVKVVSKEEMTRVADEIADILGEHEEAPRLHILGVVRVLGPEGAREVLAEAQRIQDAGGMWLPDRSRKRTFGGVFFQVARERLGNAWSETLREVQRWREEKQEAKRRRREEEERARPPWNLRHRYARKALAHPVRVHGLHAVVRWMYDRHSTKSVKGHILVVIRISLVPHLLPRVVPRPEKTTFPILALLPEHPAADGVPVIARGALQVHPRLGLVVRASQAQATDAPPPGGARLFLRGQVSVKRVRPVRVNRHLLLVGGKAPEAALVFYVPARLWRRARAQGWATVALGGQVVPEEDYLAVLVEEVREAGQ